MKKLREKITPGNWRIITWCSVPVIAVLYVLLAVTENEVLAILGLAFFGAWGVGTLLFWQCRDCGRWLPYRLLFCFDSYCPHCGERFDLI